LSSLDSFTDIYKLNSHDALYLIMPLYHTHSLIAGLLSALFSGGSVILPPKYNVTLFWKDVLSEKCTWCTATPWFYSLLLKKVKETYPGKSGKLRFLRTCGAYM